jgi:hypothetical protein
MELVAAIKIMTIPPYLIMIAKWFFSFIPLPPPRRQYFRENILGALFIIQNCPSKPMPPPQLFYASYTPVLPSQKYDEALITTNITSLRDGRDLL